MGKHKQDMQSQPMLCEIFAALERILGSDNVPISQDLFNAIVSTAAIVPQQWADEILEGEDVCHEKRS